MSTTTTKFLSCTTRSRPLLAHSCCSAHSPSLSSSALRLSPPARALSISAAIAAPIALRPRESTGQIKLSRGQFLRAPPLHRSSRLQSHSLLTSSYNYSPSTRSFSTSPINMTATKIDGTAIAKSIRERLHKEIEATQSANPRYKPSLKIIQG